MSQLETHHLIVTADKEKQGGTLLDLLQKKFSIITGEPEKKTEHYYDTFEWQLYRKGLLCVRKGIKITVTTFDGEVVASGFRSRKKRPFWWDFQDEQLQKILKSHIDIRALLPLVEVNSCTQIFKTINKDRKTTSRIRLETRTVITNGSEAALPGIVSIEPVRGYENSFTKVSELLEPFGKPTSTSGELILVSALDILKRKVLDYSPKFLLQLNRNETVSESVREICLSLLYDLEWNFPGVIKDIDTEFLHDLRIAVRRTRSLLSLFKKILPAEQTRYFQAEFKWLGSITGPVRDLDVYLLEKEKYSAMVPERLQQGLDHFFNTLAEQRKGELLKMYKNLRSERFLSLIEEWEKYLKSSVLEDHEELGQKQIRPLAKKIIKKRFQRILQEGSQLTNDSPDEALHELRIEGKKFRYLLEFFRSLFDEAEVELFVQQLKKLQNNLGEFNDLSVQLEMLGNYQDNLSGRTKQSLLIAGSLGGLITHLAYRQKRVKQKFEKTFTQFSTEKNRQLFNEMFEV